MGLMGADLWRLRLSLKQPDDGIMQCVTQCGG